MNLQARALQASLILMMLTLSASAEEQLCENMFNGALVGDNEPRLKGHVSFMLKPSLSNGVVDAFLLEFAEGVDSMSQFIGLYFNKYDMTGQEVLLEFGNATYTFAQTFNFTDEFGEGQSFADAYHNFSISVQPSSLIFRLDELEIYDSATGTLDPEVPKFFESLPTQMQVYLLTYYNSSQSNSMYDGRTNALFFVDEFAYTSGSTITERDSFDNLDQWEAFNTDSPGSDAFLNFETRTNFKYENAVIVNESLAQTGDGLALILK